MCRYLHLSCVNCTAVHLQNINGNIARLSSMNLSVTLALSYLVHVHVDTQVQ